MNVVNATQKEQRIRQAVHLKNNNHSLQQIADSLGITRQRVSQILKQANYHLNPVPPQPKRTPQQQQRRINDARSRSSQWYKANKDHKLETQRQYRRNQSVAELKELIASTRQPREVK